MPFLEIFDFASEPEMREAAGRSMTNALCEIYEIKPDIVTCYFVAFGPLAYMHGGQFSEESVGKRVFIKVHAFPRSVDLKRQAARSMTDAAARAYRVPAANVAIYFLDRAKEDVSHNGILACD